VTNSSAIAETALQGALVT